MSASTRTIRVRSYGPATGATDGGGYSYAGPGLEVRGEYWGNPRPGSADERLSAGQAETSGLYAVALPEGAAVSTDGLLKWRDGVMGRDVVAGVETVEPNRPQRELRVVARERSDFDPAAMAEADANAGWTGWGA